MVKVVIGSMVLCHLLVPGQMQQTGEGEQKVTKILGEIVDMQKGNRYIENVKDKQTLRVDTDILIIKGKNKEGVYQVDSRACMLVRDETAVEREERLFPKTKIEEKVEETTESENLEEKNNTNPADIEIQDRPAVDDAKVEEIKKLMPEVKEEIKQEVVEVKEEVKKVQEAPVEVKKEEPKAEEVKEIPVKDKKSLLDYIK